MSPTPTTPVGSEEALTQIALSYMGVNEMGFVADDVLPSAEVITRSYQYEDFAKADPFRDIDTLVADNGRAKSISYSAALQDGGTDIHGLTASVGNQELEDYMKSRNAVRDAMGRVPVMGGDPRSARIRLIIDLVKLAREKRVANLVFNDANYENASISDQAGSKWNLEASNPLETISDAIADMIVRPNKMVIGLKGWVALRRHPKIVAAVVGKFGKQAAKEASGFASREQVAELFELKKIIVGESWINSKKRGAAANYGRLWGNDASLINTRPIADTRMPLMPVFGWTALYREMMVRWFPEHDIVVQGGEAYEVSMICREKAVSKDAGYRFKNII